MSFRLVPMFFISLGLASHFGVMLPHTSRVMGTVVTEAAVGMVTLILVRGLQASGVASIANNSMSCSFISVCRNFSTPYIPTPISSGDQ